MEKWTKCQAPFGAYEISDHGQLRRADGLMLKPTLGRLKNGKPGYYRVWLRSDAGGKRFVGIHQLVAIAFVPGQAAGLEPNHKDLDKTNNRATNLEWMTRGENVDHAWKNNHGWRETCLAAARERRRPVIAKSAGTEITFESLRAAALHVGGKTRAANICHALSSGREAYGFTWRYAA